MPVALHRPTRVVLSLAAGLALSVLVCALFGWVLMQGLALARADWLSMQARDMVPRWSQGTQAVDPVLWRQSEERLLAALALTPDNAVLHDYLAALYTLRGQAAWSNDGLRRGFFAGARQHLQQSLVLRPVNGRAWAALALSLHALDEDTQTVTQALAQAVHFAPSDPKVQRQVASVVLARWAGTDLKLQQWVQALYRQEDVRTRLGLEALFTTWQVPKPGTGP